MGMMARLGSGFPDALVRKLPMLHNIVSKADERFLRLPVKGASVRGVLGCGVDYFSVHIELQVVAGSISNPYRSRITVSSKHLRFPFFWRKIAEHGIQDPQLRLCEMSRV